SLRYLQVVVSEPSSGVPQYLEMGYLDGVPIARYDSERGRPEPLTPWMAAGAGQEHWDTQTQRNKRNQQLCPGILEDL
ncbi:HMR1 protein, partial [Ptilonorhynchus violaceus]|nr:HMR1 protein [Ptilonorhynchus violaceus]